MKRTMKKNMCKTRQAGTLVLSAFFLLTCMARCKDEQKELKAAEYNPNLKVEVTGFTPDSGGAATQLMIYGSNFGSNKDEIEVAVNGKQAPVVNSNGSVIYALIPRQVREEAGICSVTLRVGEQDVAVGEFHYTPHYLVSTLVGYDVEDGKETVLDGNFIDAQFKNPYWLTFDENKNLYVIEEDNGIRFIDLKEQRVETKFNTGNGVLRPRTIAFTPGFDSMVIAHDAGSATEISQILLTKANDNFKKWTAVCYSKQCNGGAFHPVNTSEYYFNSYEASQVYKAVRSQTPWGMKELYRYGDKDWEFNIQFAPSGDFAYLVSINQSYIARSQYNWTTHELERATDFVGLKQNAGYADGSGSNARFDHPQQGAFDEYDNFYIGDAYNHCIRKITPEGIVTTFAGRPREFGNVDGNLREAQFDRPFGIVYDKDDKRFYIADQKNRCIRTISFE
jgi:DNA-binding beta-propeller fold protein YncE